MTDAADRRRARLRAPSGLAALMVFAFATFTHAQTLPAPPDPATAGVTVSAEVLDELPTAGNVFSVLETMQAETIGDRFASGGLNAGGPSHLLALQWSRRQTRYRIGAFDVGSPTDGMPLLFPDLAFWQRVDAVTALTPADLNATGLSIALHPRRPGDRWSGAVEGFGSAAGLVSAPSAPDAPPVAKLDRWARGAAVAGGPVGRRAGVFVGASVIDGHTLVRERPDRVYQNARSAFAHLVFSPTPRHELRTIGWVHAGRAAVAHQAVADQRIADLSALHVQFAFETSSGDRLEWRVFGGVTSQRRDHLLPETRRTVDRLFEGPIHAQVTDPARSERRWSVGTEVAPAGNRRPHLTIGVEYAAAAARAQPGPDTFIGETLDGLPARAWEFASPGVESHRHAFTFAVFAADRIELSPSLRFDAGLRFEAVRGRASGSATAIEWHTLLPHVVVRWDTRARRLPAFFSGYRRAADQLTLDLLAYGDSAAPTASVFRWDGATSAPLVARAGPGTGGDPAFSGIDPRLRRPHVDEFVIGVSARAGHTWRLGVSGIARRGTSFIDVVNVGVPAASYRALAIPDANVDLIGTADDQLLPVHERRPDTFGQDRYLLTNPRQPAATMGALIVTARAETRRIFVLVGATAAAVVGQRGSRGFRVDENDGDAGGELFVNANAETYARGRMFSDRAYTIKWTTVYRFPWDVRLGVIARYQDGQPFSRVVIVPGLAQGADAIQAFATGRSRFAFTGTLDVRLQKGFAAGPARLDLVLDVYNLPNMQKAVEEYVVTGPQFRRTTAVQPPRAVHVGARVRF